MAIISYIIIIINPQRYEGVFNMPWNKDWNPIIQIFRILQNIKNFELPFNSYIIIRDTKFEFHTIMFNIYIYIFNTV